MKSILDQHTPPPVNPEPAKLVDAKTLLEVLWDERSRPSLRTLRTWTANGLIPSIKLGRLVYFDPEQVRITLHHIRSRRRKS